MLVRDIMRSPAISITPETPLQDAYRTMQERGIRHLPVLEGERLLGVITDRDLRLATSALTPSPFPPEAQVRQAMTRAPLTAHPCDPVEDAAHVMRERKIGCLPVVEDERLVGIITGIDLLEALIRLTGVDRPSGRLEVRLPEGSGELMRLLQSLNERGLAIHSVLTYTDGANFVRAVLRVGSIETRRVADDLRRSGFQVSWPLDKPCRR